MSRFSLTVCLPQDGTTRTIRHLSLTPILTPSSHIGTEHLTRSALHLTRWRLLVEIGLWGRLVLLSVGRLDVRAHAGFKDRATSSQSASSFARAKPCRLGRRMQRKRRQVTHELAIGLAGDRWGPLGRLGTAGDGW